MQHPLITQETSSTPRLHKRIACAEGYVICTALNKCCWSLKWEISPWKCGITYLAFLILEDHILGETWGLFRDRKSIYFPFMEVQMREGVTAYIDRLLFCLEFQRYCFSKALPSLNFDYAVWAYVKLFFFVIDFFGPLEHTWTWTKKLLEKHRCHRITTSLGAFGGLSPKLVTWITLTFLFAPAEPFSE